MFAFRARNGWDMCTGEKGELYMKHLGGKFRGEEIEVDQRRHGLEPLIEKLERNVGMAWRSWRRISGGGMNSSRPYASTWVPQELID